MARLTRHTDGATPANRPEHRRADQHPERRAVAIANEDSIMDAAQATLHELQTLKSEPASALLRLRELMDVVEQAMPPDRTPKFGCSPDSASY